ncbi:MAG TPA: DUF429 domain-containing protein [Candidatus Eremiobacteraceae bacterium]|nr:DUF429 domain-containing protein [Candidatus Eremiobacteraceae bacterium]
MITLGVDLASQAKLTGICEIAWNAGRADITNIEVRVDDDDLKRLLGSDRIDKVGIDIPLGWPDEFVKAIGKHHAGNGWPESSTNNLRYRATGDFVNEFFKSERLGSRVLSVSSDLIAVPAFRAAKLMADLSTPVDRCGAGLICEVYPEGALRRWRFQCREYKGKKKKASGARGRLVEALLHSTREWLRISDAHRDLCKADDNALDALVSCLVARAAACKLVEEIPVGYEERASREGWIALPKAESLDRLPNPQPA